MKICMILYDPQDFGGLEEYAVTLAIGLQERGQQVSVLSTNWVSAENQYVSRLRENNIRVVQAPKWLSLAASHGPTKQRIVNILLWLFLPLILCLAFGLFVLRRKTWRQSLISAHGWLRGQLFTRFFAQDRYKPLTRLLLNWWSFRWHPDLLHIQGYTSNLLFVIDWADQNHIPVVYEEHQTPDAQFEWWKEFKHSINKAKIVVAVSEKSAEALKTVCGVTRPVVVRNPLLPDPMLTGWKKDKRQPDQPGRFTMTTVARLFVTKGLRYLVSAIPLVKEKYPNVEFKVYGDGPLRHELLDYAGQLDLDGEAIFVGPFTSREELSRIMANTDIFVMSSILEGQPLGVVEAMAYGCPIVTTSVGGIPELIKNNVNGLLCEPADPECLARQICKLLDDPELRDRLGSAARRSYEQGPYQPAAVCEHFISIYKDVLDKANYSEGEDLSRAASF